MLRERGFKKERGVRVLIENIDRAILPAEGGFVALRTERADELLQADGITSADFATPDYRGVDPNVGLVMLSGST